MLSPATRRALSFALILVLSLSLSVAQDQDIETVKIDTDLVTVPVLQEELLVVTAARHPLSRKRKVLPQDLVGQPFVLFESGSNTRRAVSWFMPET